jgi:acetyl esterase/lipase
MVVAFTVAPLGAAEAEKLLPDETEMLVTVNVRAFLEDQKNTTAVQRWVERWRLALQGDVKQLATYYHAEDLLKSEGLTERAFLDQAQKLKAFNDALGMDLLKDVDRITCAFKTSNPGLLAVVVEGRFSTDKFPTAVKQLVKEHGGTCKVRKVGDSEVWQIPEDADGVNLVLLNAGTLAITSRARTMDELLARGTEKKGRLSQATRTLLEKGRKEHILFLADHVDLLVQDRLKSLSEQIVKTLSPGDALGKAVVDQMASVIQKYGKEVSALSFGLSFREEELRLHWGVVARKPETAKELATWADRGNLLGSLALRTFDSGVTRQLADILLRVRVVRKDASITIHAEVPYEVITTFWQQPWSRITTLAYSALDGLGRRVTSIPIWGPVQPSPAGALEVEEVRDVAYDGDGKTAPFRHRLDLFLPKGKKAFPVVVLVHGGGWIIGDNRACGLYTTVGQFLASQGIAAVLPNYRLSPSVRHPDHVKDVARAVKWARDNMAKYGAGEQLFLMGHSAGAHLVALLATDESYLRGEGLKAADIAGVIAISGVYHIPAGAVESALGGSGRRAFHLEQVVPLRGEAISPPRLPVPGLPLKLNVYGLAFGDDPAERAKASPLSHVRHGLPPFLILTAENDLPSLHDTADEFQRALQREGCNSRLVEVRKRNHNSILFSAITPEDPAARAILEFLRQEPKRK